MSLVRARLRGFSANVIKSADNDHSRSVIDDHINARALLEGTDIASLAADDTSFHVVAGNIDGADGGVGGMLGRIALNGRGQDASGFFFTGGPQHLLVFLDASGDLAAEFPFQPVQEHALGLFAREMADVVQQFTLLLHKGFRFLVAFLQVATAFGQLALGILQRPFLFRQGLGFLLQPIFALVEAALHFAVDDAFLLHFAVEFFPLFEQLVLGIDLGAFANGFGIAFCLGRDLGNACLNIIETEPVAQLCTGVAEP